MPPLKLQGSMCSREKAVEPEFAYHVVSYGRELGGEGSIKCLKSKLKTNLNNLIRR